MYQVTPFDTLKNALSSPPVLGMYDPNRDIKVSADASSYSFRGILFQMWADEWKPIAYALWPLTPTEQQYAQVEKEFHMSLWTVLEFPDRETFSVWRRP